MLQGAAFPTRHAQPRSQVPRPAIRKSVYFLGPNKAWELDGTGKHLEVDPTNRIFNQPTSADVVFFHPKTPGPKPTQVWLPGPRG